jgi:hypothetical protein
LFISHLLFFFLFAFFFKGRAACMWHCVSVYFIQILLVFIMTDFLGSLAFIATTLLYSVLIYLMKMFLSSASWFRNSKDDKHLCYWVYHVIRRLEVLNVAALYLRMFFFAPKPFLSWSKLTNQQTNEMHKVTRFKRMYFIM